MASAVALKKLRSEEALEVSGEWLLDALPVLVGAWGPLLPVEAAAPGTNIPHWAFNAAVWSSTQHRHAKV